MGKIGWSKDEERKLGYDGNLYRNNSTLNVDVLALPFMLKHFVSYSFQMTNPMTPSLRISLDTYFNSPYHYDTVNKIIHVFSEEDAFYVDLNGGFDGLMLVKIL
jgi:hypothetical protein